MASEVPSKSAGVFITKKIVAFMKEVGCQSGTIILKSDQEPAMTAIVRDVIMQRVADGEEKPVEHEVTEREKQKMRGRHGLSWKTAQSVVALVME